MPRLLHVSHDLLPAVLLPRPSPPGTEHEGRLLVWAVDDEHLVNYLLPRDCPRVTWAADPAAPQPLRSTYRRVVAVEHGWLARVREAVVRVHVLDPAGLTLVEPVAGYWVSDGPVRVTDVEVVDDCVTAIAGRGVELRAVASLWPLMDAVVRWAGEFSGIRLRNAAPRPS